ncbi:MAG: three-Cys-motif partner protein TcmP [Cellulomonadaceae bacterium]|nr:three-Cys-motif partner protein TcmP [Cellulomonadaceae bacterium]
MENFHETKKSAAVLKHAILDQYASPFVGMTGKYSQDHRVAFVDGYAGPGRYGDDEEGSGALLLRKAKELVGIPRTVELHFVEDDPATVERLRAVIAEEGEGVTATVTDGDIAAHLPHLLQTCAGVPLFVYLDPCGLVIPFDQVVQVFNRPGGLGAPATEVLINFSAVSLRRIAGHLTSDKAIEKTLERMDQVCGGDWWRQVWLDSLPDKEAAEEAVVQGYAERLSKRAKSGHWVIDVRPRADLKPIYYLVFASRHHAGMETFGEAASLGLERWRRYNASMAARKTLFGGDNSWEAAFKQQEATLKARWVDGIAQRLTEELAKGHAFRVIDRYTEVFGDAVGLARGLHLRAAIKKVLAAGKTSTNPVGEKNMYELRLVPA